MKKIDVGQSITILANLGVIAGIVFLAIEVRQNQATLEEGNAMNLVAVQTAAQESRSRFRTLILENDVLFQIWRNGLNGEELSELEAAKFDELCFEQIFWQSTTHRTYLILGQDSEANNAARVVQANIGESERYRECWERAVAIFTARGQDAFVSLVQEPQD